MKSLDYWEDCFNIWHTFLNVLLRVYCNNFGADPMSFHLASSSGQIHPFMTFMTKARYVNTATRNLSIKMKTKDIG